MRLPISRTATVNARTALDECAPVIFAINFAYDCRVEHAGSDVIWAYSKSGWLLSNARLRQSV
eukprot:6186074-Pleurochrysis_carterae.AAC.1